MLVTLRVGTENGMMARTVSVETIFPHARIRLLGENPTIVMVDSIELLEVGPTVWKPGLVDPPIVSVVAYCSFLPGPETDRTTLEQQGWQVE
jgi:hypothetical protein